MLSFVGFAFNPFKAILDSKQVLFLCPTTILANQQYETFRDRMKEYPIRIEVLNRFKTKQQTERILRGISNGEVDLVCGIHRVFSKEVDF